MDDVEGSQTGETEAAEDFEEETKVFLVSWTNFNSWPSYRSLPRSDWLTQRLQLPGSTPTAASFEFRDEGHTLGNALRYIIMKK